MFFNSKDDHHNTGYTFSVILMQMSSLVKWYHHILEALFVIKPESKNKTIPALNDLPQDFAVWFENNKSKFKGNEEQYWEIITIFKNLNIVFSDLKMKAEQKKKIKHEDYALFEAAFEKYFDVIFTILQDYMGLSQGQFGLKNKKQMLDDLRREIERLNRKGAGFCLAAFRVDGEQDLAVQEKVVEIFKQSLRLFDDIYDVEDGYYVISLKQIDMRDAESVLERLRQKIEGHYHVMKVQNKTFSTISVGMTEVLPKETPEQLLDYVIKAVQDAQKKGGNQVEQYEEVSKLVAFARQTQEEK